MMIETEQHQCLIWRDYSASVDSSSGFDGKEIDSARAGGRYRVTGSAVPSLADLSPARQVLITDLLIEQRRQGINCPTISTNIFEVIGTRLQKSIDERQTNLLRHLCEYGFQEPIPFKISDEGKSHYIKSREKLLAHSSSTKPEQVIGILEYLQRQNWVEMKEYPKKGGELATGGYEILVTVEGHVHLRSLDSVSPESSTVFVAMWFNSEVASLYNEAIQPGINEAGYEPVRIDQTPHNGNITNAIIAEIKRSRFIVADFTCGECGKTQRGGVYYEAGFARGLGLEVIHCVKKEQLSNVHFDTAQINHITWEDGEMDAFKKEITDRIVATIGQGPNLTIT